MKLLEKHRKKLLTLLLGFLIPFTIISLLLALRGIWWGSEITILASDGFHQYVIFNQVLRNTLQGNGSLFYNFTSGLGLNFYALMSYYLGSFLSPLVYFFDLRNMPDALYLFTIVKFGLIGLSSTYSLSCIYHKLNRLSILLLSTSFTLMSFVTSQLEINIWLDVFILIPLILLGLHRLVTNQGILLYFISLVSLFIQNYYFGFMTAIFLSFWFILQISWDVKGRIRSFIDFTVVSILAGLSSLVMLLPTYLDLKTHGETFTEIVNFQTDNSWYLDLFAKNLVGSYDTTQFGAIPMISVGLFPLILTILFFTIKSIKPLVKCAYATFLLLLIASFYIEVLDLAWQGMHAPNMFLHRYAWIFSTVIIYMAAETLVRIEEIKKIHLSIPFLFLVTGFFLTFYFGDRYPYLEPIHFILTVEFLLAYSILLLGKVYKKIPFKIFSLLSLGFVLFEMGLHSHYQIEGLAAEWNFPSRSNYEDQLTEIDNLVKGTNSKNSYFYRTEKLDIQTGNDSMKYNYYGISQFSSIRNRSSSSTLDKLGFRSDGTNLNLRYQNNTIIADSLFAVKYNLAESDPLKYGFSLYQTEVGLSSYKNEYATQLAILTEGVYKDVKFTNLTLDNQTRFLNQITGLEQTYFTKLYPLSVKNATELNNRVTVQTPENEDMPRVNYELTVPADSQLYISIPNISFSNQDQEIVQISVNNMSTNFTLDNTFSIFNIGYFEKGQNLNVVIRFPYNSQVSFDQPQFYHLDTRAYQAAMGIIKSQKVEVKTYQNMVEANYNATKESSLLFTLPYDKGWSASLNGKPIKIRRAQHGFMKIDVPKGQGTVVLTFVPQGFWTGLLSSLAGIILFFLYSLFKQRRKLTLSQTINT
jgi:uncharacterized membrane protein YfhO